MCLREEKTENFYQLQGTIKLQLMKNERIVKYA